MAEYDVAVIGGGLVGASIASGLVGLGQKVCLFDEGDLAHRASRANFALVWVQGKGAGDANYGNLTKRSSLRWGDWARELEAEADIPLSFEQPGGFTLALSPGELAARADVLRRVQQPPGAEDYGCEMIDRPQLEKILPAIGPEVVGASYCRYDGHVNSLRLLRALHTSFGRKGGESLPCQRVERIVPLHGGGFRIETEGLTATAEKVAIAAGLGNARLAPMVGLSSPVHPLKGQIVITEKLAPFLHHPLVNLRQTSEGGVMIGSSMEEAGFDETSTMDVLGDIARRMVRLFPILASANIVRTWAGLRVMTPDGRPVYDQSVQYPGAFSCVCHSGVTLAAVHATSLAGSIRNGVLSEGFEHFSVGRFDVQAGG